jgi:hypothetical protein
VLPERLRRFLHLERARREGSGPIAELPDDERFRRIREPVPPAAPADGSAAPSVPLPPDTVGRFLPPPERGLEIDARPPGVQPFRRCVRCHADSSAHAGSCWNCGASLDEPEQRDFNEKLWAGRLAEEEAERREGERLRAEREADAEAGSLRRAAESRAAQEGWALGGERGATGPDGGLGAGGGPGERALARRPRWARLSLVAGLALALLLTLGGWDRGLGLLVFLGVLAFLAWRRRN